MGARNVLISMAGEGAVLIAEDGQVFDKPAPKGHLVNAVGAGRFYGRRFYGRMDGQTGL